MSSAIRNLGLALLGWMALCTGFASVGDDVAEVFARAARGEPLRYVAIGGSITQDSGDGWAGEWLREQFPQSDVSIVNSGMSATGSALGIFRIERDIIAHQPDLVVIEYCVNDGGLSDEDAVRYMETMVVRLKSLPRPPAIIIVEAAAKHGVNLSRHRRVAQHYGLAEVDMQAAMDTKGADAWDDYFKDNVHPNKAGHALYTQTMIDALTPLAERAREDTPPPAIRNLPEPLSVKPLLLDARLVPLQGYRAKGWTTQPSLPFWWNRFFQGVLNADEPETVLRIPVRGTTVGIFYAMSKDYGSFFASVNGEIPRHIFTNTRGGYSSNILGIELPAQEHVLTVALPAAHEANPAFNGPVKLGYLLVAGETGATHEASPQGAFDAEALRSMTFTDIPASAWQWAGPFTQHSNEGEQPMDALPLMNTPFIPEPDAADFSATDIPWQSASGEDALVNLRKMIGEATPAVAYLRTTLHNPEDEPVLFSISVDYYAHVWLNGERILTLDGPHTQPFLLSSHLRPGANELWIKVGAGRGGHNFGLSVAPIALATNREPVSATTD